MSHNEDSLTYSSLESDNITESILEGNMNVTNCFEPYQGELLPDSEYVCTDSESSDEEQDEDYILPSVLEKRLKKIFH
jgi:hypothetical protein